MCCIGSVCMYLFERYIWCILSIYTHGYIHTHIYACTFLCVHTGDFWIKHTLCTPRASCASLHCSTPDFPRVIHGGPEVPQEERNSWIERLSNLCRALACLLSSLPEEERSLPWNIKPFWEERAFPSWKEADDSRGNMD